MNVGQMKEAHLARHLDIFARQLSLRVIATEVQIGAYRLDAVAIDSSGELVVIEFKANAHIATLSQLLLYPHALSKALKAKNVTPPPIRAVLITTHLDTNLVEVVRGLSGCAPIEAWVCVGSVSGELALAAPRDAGEQAWDQSMRGTHRIDEILQFVGDTSGFTA